MKTIEERRAYGRAWRQANKEYILERNRKYVSENRDAVRAFKKAWNEANRDRTRQYSKNWAKKNPEKALEIFNRWKANNPERAKEIVTNWKIKNPEKYKANNYNSKQKRKIREKKVFETIDRKSVFRKFGYICCYCGVDTSKAPTRIFHPNEPTIDHVIPLAKGGTHTYDNLQLLCRRCNLKKGTKILNNVGMTTLDL